MTNYPNYYYPPQYVQPMYSQLPMQGTQSQNQQSNQQQTNRQVQNSGFVMVRSEDEVYRYPVTPGNCVTFKIENEPIVIEKSMSFSQLDSPRIDRYRLVREEVIEPPAIVESVSVEPLPTDELKDELQAIRHEIESIKKRLDRPGNNNQLKKSEGNKNE